MEMMYILIGLVIGTGLGLFLDVDYFTNMFVKKEEELDSKNENSDKENK